MGGGRCSLTFLCVLSPIGIINLRACKSHKNKFEQGMIDEFTVEAVDMGELEKLRIGHDNSGMQSGSRSVNQSGGQSGSQLCNKSIHQSEDRKSVV